VDDFGNVINPMIVEGQVHGGIAQGIGQALLENCVYDTAVGQLLTGSLHGLRHAARRRPAELPGRDRTLHALHRTTRWA
jgi:xanthine dehydrogenase molybdopterin-binding subunit B